MQKDLTTEENHFLWHQYFDNSTGWYFWIEGETRYWKEVWLG
jgi:hypothetical protein